MKHDTLLRLHRAGLIRTPWLPGMLYEVRLGALVPAVVRPVEAPPDTFLGVPDLTDPATAGCLTALLREARKDPTVHTFPWGTGWCAAVLSPDPKYPNARYPNARYLAEGPTDGAAVGAALDKLADTLPDSG